MKSVGSLISELDASERKEALSLLVERIAQLPLTAKNVLALYYHEELHAAEIAVLLGLTKDEIEQIRAETLGLLQTALLVWHDLKRSRIAPSVSWYQTNLATCSENDPPSADRLGGSSSIP